MYRRKGEEDGGGGSSDGSAGLGVFFWGIGYGGGRGGGLWRGALLCRCLDAEEKKICEKGKGNERKKTGAGFIEQVGILLKKALEINSASNQNKVNSEKLS